MRPKHKYICMNCQTQKLLNLGLLDSPPDFHISEAAPSSAAPDHLL